MAKEFAQQTRYHIVKLTKVEVFPCSKKDVKESFEGGKLDWVSMGGISKVFEFDHRCHHRPKIKGQVIAALTVGRNNQSYFCLYPIRRDT